QRRSPCSSYGVGKCVVPYQQDGSIMVRIVDSLLLSGISVSSVNVEEASLDGRHLAICCILVDGNEKIATHALIDSGATGFTFVDEYFVRHHNLRLTCLETPRKLEVI